jgi:hypothetical protein
VDELGEVETAAVADQASATATISPSILVSDTPVIPPPPPQPTSLG